MANLAKPQPISDVAQPGKSAASPTSKQIIIANRPIIKDPMVLENPTSVSEIAPNDKLIAPTHVDLTPPTIVAAANPAEVKSSEPVAEPDDPAPPDEFKLDDTNPLADESAADAGTLHAQAVSELIAKETYYLPITSPEQKRARRFALFGLLLILVLTAAWADIALDAGLLQINGLHAPTHFFSN